MVAAKLGTASACKTSRGERQATGDLLEEPPRNPESNGLAEAFFGSFKRDHVHSGLP